PCRRGHANSYSTPCALRNAIRVWAPSGFSSYSLLRSPLSLQRFPVCALRAYRRPPPLQRTSALSKTRDDDSERRVLCAQRLGRSQLRSLPLAGLTRIARWSSK